jgi:hypothetical protein
MNTDHFEYQRRVNMIAHQLWLDAGKPDDRGVEHWNRAVEIIATADEAENFWPSAAAE